jgi:tRNA1(Val) A37 N6-methylase TrmN6
MSILEEPPFPYYKLFVKKDDIIGDFNKLSGHKLKKRPKLTENSIVSYSYETQKDMFLIQITDYFSEECRLKCSFSKFISPIEYYNENYKKIEKIDFKDYWDFSQYFLTKVHPCNNFSNFLALGIYRFFKPKRILDFSAGWGDRLIGALAYGKAEYKGIDPSKCMQPVYKEIINFFTTYCPDITGLKEKYKVIQKPFEEYKVKENHYDLVFTSPPFFVYEKYETDNKKQSMDRYTDLESWKEFFLFSSLRKCIKALVPGGHIAIYIEDFDKNKYVKDTIKMMEKENVSYLGTVTWYNESRKKIKYRNAYVWKKLPVKE